LVPAVVMLVGWACGDWASAFAETSDGSASAVMVQPQRGWDDAVLYFVILDRFADGDPANNPDVDRAGKGAFHGGDLAGLIAQLDEIAGLGATALWITPVVQQIPGPVSGAGFFDWGYHGYWADDFETVDPRFGTEAQLAALVEACHARGMKVLLDVVYNHAGYGSRYLKTHGRDWLRFGSECGSDDLTMCLSELPDFKTEKPEVRDYLLDVQLSRARRVGVDGFRLDTVKHVTHEFWQEHRRRADALMGPDFFLLGEVWGGDAQSLDPWFAGDEMDAGLDFSLQGSVTGFLLGRGRPVAFDRYLTQREKVRAGYVLSPYLSSHDTEGALATLGGDGDLFRLAVVLQMTARGMPCIFYGEEVGRAIGVWPDNRTDMPWGDRGVLPGAGVVRDEALREFYQRLIAIRRAHPAIWRGEREGLAFGADHLVFARRDAVSGDAVLVGVNRGGAEAVVTVAAPAAWAGKVVTDHLTGREVVVRDGQATLVLPPRSALIVGPK
jgi:alpha-amylase